MSNGYGFICFENEEDTIKFIECEKNEVFEGIQTFKFRLQEQKNLKNTTNNLYIKNFDPSWDEAKIREIFGVHGVINSVSVREDPAKAERRFAFVCYSDPKNPEAGFISAEKAILDLNEREINGQKLYVVPA